MARNTNASNNGRNKRKNDPDSKKVQEGQGTRSKKGKKTTNEDTPKGSEANQLDENSPDILGTPVNRMSDLSSKTVSKEQLAHTKAQQELNFSHATIVNEKINGNKIDGK